MSTGTNTTLLADSKAKGSRAKSGCKCVETMDAKLAPENTKLEMALMVFAGPGDAVVRPVVATVKVDEKKRGRAKTALASYCPFCGVKL